MLQAGRVSSPIPRQEEDTLKRRAEEVRDLHEPSHPKLECILSPFSCGSMHYILCWMSSIAG